MQGHDAWRTKVDDRTYQVDCFNCGKTFEAARSDASFCSPRCRVHFSRAPQRRRAALERLKAIANEVDTISRTYSRSQELFEAVQSLERRIAAALGNFEMD